MLRGRFGLENQAFGSSIGAIDMVFRDLSVPTSPGNQKRLFRKAILRTYETKTEQQWNMTPACDPKQWVLGDLDDVTWTRVILAV